MTHRESDAIEPHPAASTQALPRHVAPGHYYSPIPSGADVDRARARADRAPRTLPGIDLREPGQLALLAGLQPLYDDLHLPEQPQPGWRFTCANTWFTYADAIGYALMLRHLRPRRVVEVGAGFSSALALDVADRFLDPPPRFTFVDPDPQRLRDVVGPEDLQGRLIAAAVQDVDPAGFSALAAGDVLMIDSSHVLKAGSDVQYLLDEVLPLLPAGVHVHVHDVFWPFEYPPSWLRQGVAVNEAYAIRTLLTGGDRFRVVLFNTFLMRFHRAWFAEHMPLFLAGDFPTGGIWLERC